MAFVVGNDYYRQAKELHKEWEVIGFKAVNDFKFEGGTMKQKVLVYYETPEKVWSDMRLDNKVQEYVWLDMVQAQ